MLPRSSSAALVHLVLVTSVLLAFAPRVAVSQTQSFFPLSEVRPGLHGVGRTVFQGSRVDEFQVEILGTLSNLAPRQSIILAKLSGGPLAETGVMQGMSGSPVYIGGKLLGAVALAFPFAKEPIAGITPIEQIVSGSPLPGTASAAPARASLETPYGNLTEISTPLSFSGFTGRTLQVFGDRFRKLGFEPQQGLSAGTPTSTQYNGVVVPGSMISIELLSGDMVISADGTVTHVDGKHVYALGHRFLNTGSTELPFARADVIALLPALNTSFKLSAARELVGTMLSDRATAIAGEIGRPARTVPLTISVHSAQTSRHDYHFNVVTDRLLTPFITQSAIFSTIDATERTVGVGTLRLRGTVEFAGAMPALHIDDTFVSESGLAQQVASDAVVAMAFVLSGGFSDLRLKNIAFDLEPVETKRQLRIAQVWASAHEARPGDTVQITAVLQGENGLELTRTSDYRIPVGAPNGALNFTISDANTINAPEFAGIAQSQLRSAAQLVNAINAFRGAEAAYIRVWRQEPSFNIAGPMPGGELTDPPPSVMLVLADPSASTSSNASNIQTRGSQIAELKIPVPDYVITGARTIQIEVKD